jgi:hypothetical protein
VLRHVQISGQQRFDWYIVSWFAASGSRASSRVDHIQDIFKAGDLCQLGAALSSSLARFLPMLGFTKRDAMPTFLGSGACASGAMKSTNSLPFLGGRTALNLGSL